MKRFVTIFFMFVLLAAAPALAVEVAPRISDREIVESLSELKAGQKALNKRIDDLGDNINQRIDDLSDNINKRIDGQGDSINKRIDDLGDFLKIFIAIATACLGFVIRMTWKNSQMLETQKDEIAWLKEMINKLLPPKQIL